MTPLAIAAKLGVTTQQADARFAQCDACVVGEEFVAVRCGNVGHLGVGLRGLGGRKVLRAVRATLQAWLNDLPAIYGPVKKGDAAALRFVRALGFEDHAETATHFVLVLKRGTS